MCPEGLQPRCMPTRYLGKVVPRTGQSLEGSVRKPAPSPPSPRQDQYPHSNTQSQVSLF